MRTWLIKSALACSVFAAVWIGSVMLWNARNQMPTSGDVMLYLVVLPLTLLLVIWLTRKGFAAIVAPSIPSASLAQSRSEQQTPGQEAALQERAAPLIILFSAIRAAHGTSAGELSQALSSKEARPALDPELTDADGYPILSCRVQDIDEEAQRKVLAQWLNAHDLPELNWSSEQLRALAMAGELAIELGRSAIVHPLLEEYTAAVPAKRSAIALPTLQLTPVLPLDWEQPQRHAASCWLLDLVEQQGWPPEKTLLSPPAPSAASGPLGIIDQLSVHAYRQAHPFLGILIACDSCIGEQTVNAWENAGKLFTSKNDAGLIPGEGAAGLMLADAEHAASMGLDSAARMHRVAQGRRIKSADASGRISADLLSQLTRDALAAADTIPEKVMLVAADTDHRASRMAELMEAGYQTFPELDLKTQCHQVAAHCGASGAVSSLLALALAHHEAATNGNCAMCLNNRDGFDRAAVLVTPALADLAELKIAA